MLNFSTQFGDEFMKIYDFDGKNNVSGERIRELRNKKHWSQEQLAAKMQLAGVGIGRDSVNRLERGKRVIPDYEIRALAEIFGVSPAWILGME